MVLLFCLVGGSTCAYAYIRYHTVRTRALPSLEPASSIQIGGFNLFFRLLGAEDGGETPIIVLHGGPGHSSKSFKSSLDGLATTTSRRVLFYDQRGSGLSEVKAETGLYTIQHLVTELDAMREQVLHADRVILIGHSAGGALAQHYAAAHPGRVERLVLVGSPPANNSLWSSVFWAVFGPGMYTLALGTPPADADAADAWLASAPEAEDLKRLHDKAKRDLVLQDNGPCHYHTWFAVSQSLAGADLSPTLPRFRGPVLIAYGVSDSPSTGADAAKSIQRLLPQARVAPIEESGHWPFLENPEAFLPIVEEFLRQPVGEGEASPPEALPAHEA
jgi:proline iminopeptidase